MRDMMSDTKVYVTDEQPWVAVGGDSTTQTTPKCTQVGTKMFTWSTTPMSRTRQESRNIEREKAGIKREGGKIIKEEGEKWNGTKRGRKREGRGKQRKRESENVSGLKTKSGKKKTKKLISCIEKGEKTATHQSKSTAQKRKTTPCRLDGDSVVGEWRML